MSFIRPYSPVPPPCPSPQLMPMPLPTPPVYARRPSLPQSSPTLKKDAGRSTLRRHSRHNLRKSDNFIYAATAGADSSFEIDPLPSSLRRKHRRSDSMSPSQSSLSQTSRSLSRTRTCSPSGRPVSFEVPPPVPPLPPLTYQSSAKTLVNKRPSAIGIPELGLGLRRERVSKESDAPSFLHMSKRDAKRSRASVGGPLTGCLSLRTSHSLPDIRAAKLRGNSSFAGRLLRLGTQQVVH